MWALCSWVHDCWIALTVGKYSIIQYIFGCKPSCLCTILMLASCVHESYIIIYQCLHCRHGVSLPNPNRQKIVVGTHSPRGVLLLFSACHHLENGAKGCVGCLPTIYMGSDTQGNENEALDCWLSKGTWQERSKVTSMNRKGRDWATGGIITTNSSWNMLVLPRCHKDTLLNGPMPV